MHKRILPPLLTAAVTAAFMGAPALAQNTKGGGTSSSAGVIVIDQARAEAGGITPGDAPGFPVTLSQPGNYRLMGNLTVADPNVQAIEVTTNNVTLDLNGFLIQGPVTCSTAGTPATMACQPTGTYGSGVYAGSNTFTTIRNGKVRGFANGVVAGYVGTVEAIDVTQASNIGIVAGYSSQVVGNKVTYAKVAGISASNGAVRENSVYWAGVGVQSGFGGLVDRNVIHWVTTGIAGQQGNAGASGNTISVATTMLYQMTQMGPNLCNGALC